VWGWTRTKTKQSKFEQTKKPLLHLFTVLPYTKHSPVPPITPHADDISSLPPCLANIATKNLNPTLPRSPFQISSNPTLLPNYPTMLLYAKLCLPYLHNNGFHHHLNLQVPLRCHVFTIICIKPSQPDQPKKVTSSLTTTAVAATSRHCRASTRPPV